MVLTGSTYLPRAEKLIPSPFADPIRSSLTELARKTFTAVKAADVEKRAIMKMGGATLQKTYLKLNLI